MEIRLSGLGKRFNRHWLFSDINHSFTSGRYAVTGPNGSGKSTFIQIISGFQLPSEGKVEWISEGRELEPETWFKRLSLATPYMDLIEDFTLEEHIDFHFRFKHIRSQIDREKLIDIGYFTDSRGKMVRHFSSGMKQRLKLLLAFYTDCDVLLLDEPTTNMDARGLEWYREQVSRLDIPLLIVASNQEQEYQFCNEEINISNYKNS